MPLVDTGEFPDDFPDVCNDDTAICPMHATKELCFRHELDDHIIEINQQHQTEWGHKLNSPECKKKRAHEN